MRGAQTEAGAALAFVASIARAVAADGPGITIDEEAEFVGHCRRAGVEPTDERYELACDVGLALVELAGGDPAAAAELAGRVPLEELVGRLEARGWRRAFLERPVGGG